MDFVTSGRSWYETRRLSRMLSSTNMDPLGNCTLSALFALALNFRPLLVLYISGFLSTKLGISILVTTVHDDVHQRHRQ